MGTIRARISNLKPLHFLIALFFLGAVVDFLFNGILKIVWSVIYLPVYLGIALTLYNRVLSGKFKPFAGAFSIAFLCGAGIGHFTFTGQTQLRTYMMTQTADSQLAFQSKDFSDTLFISSERLSQTLVGRGANSVIPVTMKVESDYGCIRSFKVSTAAGVDVMFDPKARWVWRKRGDVGLNGDVTFAGMEEENRRRPWCLIRWF